MNPMNFVENPLDDQISSLRDKEIEKFMNMIHSTHKSVQLEGLVAMRVLISLNDDPPIQKVIDSGIVPKFLEILASETETQFLVTNLEKKISSSFSIKIESSWCILNICSREKFTEYIIELGGLDIIINLFDSQVEEVVTNAVWAMRNIVGNGSKYRDMCLQRDCVPKLLQILERFPTSQNIIEEALYGIANLCQGIPQRDQILPVLPALYKHLSGAPSQEALLHILWALTYITSNEENCQEVIDQAFVPYLIVHLCAGGQGILVQVLRTLGHLIAGDDGQMNAVLIFPKFLPKLFELTKNSEKSIRKDAFWMISNIAGGHPEQMSKVLENDDYVLRLKTALSTEPRIVANEVAYAIVNMFLRANSEQISCLVDKHGLLESLAYILESFEDLRSDILEAVLKVLKAGKSDAEIDYKKYVKEAGLVEIIQVLANDDEFRSEAKIILKYLKKI